MNDATLTNIPRLADSTDRHAIMPANRYLLWGGRLLKFGVSAAVLAYLIRDAMVNATFTQLAEQAKNWPRLGAAFAVGFVAVLVTIVRWFVLVRALAIPFTLHDALRLGFLGYLFNFVSLGSVGGDLFKAIFLAREQPTRRPESVASVVVDRAVGLYGLFVLASLALLVVGRDTLASHETRVLAQGTWIATAVGTVTILALLLPGATGGTLSQWLCKLPKIGGTFAKLIGAVRIYRRRMGVIVATIAMSVLSHGLFATTIYLLATGLPGQAPTFLEHLAIVPLAMVTGILPLPLSGLGAFEGVLDYLYRSASVVGPQILKGQGLVVALAYRAVTIAIAVVSCVFYLGQRQEVDAVMHEAEELQESAAA